MADMRPHNAAQHGQPRWQQSQQPAPQSQQPAPHGQQPPQPAHQPQAGAAAPVVPNSLAGGRLATVVATLRWLVVDLIPIVLWCGSCLLLGAPVWLFFVLFARNVRSRGFGESTGSNYQYQWPYLNAEMFPDRKPKEL
jgi:hypothetical protein